MLWLDLLRSTIERTFRWHGFQRVSGPFGWRRLAGTKMPEVLARIMLRWYLIHTKRAGEMIAASNLKCQGYKIYCRVSLKR